MYSMPQEKVREFLMDRENKRFARYIIIMVLLGILIVLTPYVCIRVKRAQMEAQGYEWVSGECDCDCPACSRYEGYWKPISD